jgi:hypothetical protein
MMEILSPYLIKQPWRTNVLVLHSSCRHSSLITLPLPYPSRSKPT